MSLSPDDFSPVQRAFFDRRMASLLRFASAADARHCPVAIREPHSRADWLSLAERDRAERIVAYVLRGMEEYARDRAALISPPDSATSPDDRPAAVLPASRFVVACAGGCGRMLPASSSRPVFRLCSKPHADAAPRRAPRPRDGVAPRPKARHRAVCAGSLSASA